MTHYLVTLGVGITRNVIASSPFEAIRVALGTLTLSEQSVITVGGFRIVTKPVEAV